VSCPVRILHGVQVRSPPCGGGLTCGKFQPQ
jgi:hypothetical protein